MAERLPEVGEVFYLRCVCLQVMDHPEGGKPTVVFTAFNERGEMETPWNTYAGQVRRLGTLPGFIVFPREKRVWRHSTR